MGETANGRTGDARIRTAGSMSLRRFLRPGERIGLVRCCRLAHSPFRRFPLDSWLLTPIRSPRASASRSGSASPPAGFPQRETPISLFPGSQIFCLGAGLAAREVFATAR
jgi:hypothetical protein